jgi:hypothetical protein
MDRAYKPGGSSKAPEVHLYCEDFFVCGRIKTASGKTSYRGIEPEQQG